jgi:hypothetical protein
VQRRGIGVGSGRLGLQLPIVRLQLRDVSLRLLVEAADLGSLRQWARGDSPLR